MCQNIQLIAKVRLVCLELVAHTQGIGVLAQSKLLLLLCYSDAHLAAAGVCYLYHDSYMAWWGEFICCPCTGQPLSC